MSRRAVAWAAAWFVVGLAMVGGALAIQHRVQTTVAAQFRSGQLVQATVVACTGGDRTRYKVIFVTAGGARQVTLVPSGADPQLPVGAEIGVAISRHDPALVVGDGQLTSQQSFVRLSELIGIFGVIVIALSVVLPVAHRRRRIEAALTGGHVDHVDDERCAGRLLRCGRAAVGVAAAMAGWSCVDDPLACGPVAPYICAVRVFAGLDRFGGVAG